MPDTVVRQVVAYLPSYGEVSIPYWEIASGREGPVLLVTAAQHGCEVQGPEVVRRMAAIAGEDLHSGVLLAVPFCNRPALRKPRHHLNSGPAPPSAQDDRQNNNSTWPGAPAGNDTERLCHALCRELVERATHVMDVHCWSRFTAAACLPRKDRPESMALARVSALPFALPRVIPADPNGPPRNCNLGTYFNNTGRVGLSLELSGQYCVVEKQVLLGLRCLLNAGRLLGMLPGDPEGLDEGPVWLDERVQVQVNAPSAGLFVEADLSAGDDVREGQLLGHLFSDAGLSVTPVLAPATGRLYEFGCHRRHCDVALPDMHPYASAGDRLATLGAHP